MDDKLLTALNEAGVDVQETLRRFMDRDDLYQKFLFKFVEDKTFEKIKPAMDALDMETALIEVHTLKGVTGNLGFKRLFNACVNTVNLIRQQEAEKALESYEELQEAYNEVYSIIIQFREQ